MLTGHWRFEYYKSIRNAGAPIDSSLNYHDGDFLFGNCIAKRVYNILSSQPTAADEPNSLITLIRADCWMSVLIEDIPRKLLRRGKGGNEPRVLKQRYSKLLPDCTVQLINEILDHLLQVFDIDSLEGSSFRSELRISDSNDIFIMLGNNHRKYTTAVKHNDGKYYIYLKPSCFIRHVSSSIGYISDCILGYCTDEKRSMERFVI